MPSIIHFAGATLHYVTRAEWGAGPVTVGYPMPIPPGLVGHHTVGVAPDYDRDGMTTGDFDDMAQFMRYLKGGARPDLGPEVPYSWVNFEDVDPWAAWIFEGRGPLRTGAHTAGLNSKRYGVAAEGNTSIDDPSPGLVRAYAYLRREFTTMGVATTGHRDHKATACPGDGLYGKLAEIDRLSTEEDEPMAYWDCPVSLMADDDGSVWVLVKGVGATRTSEGGFWADAIKTYRETGVMVSRFATEIVEKIQRENAERAAAAVEVPAGTACKFKPTVFPEFPSGSISGTVTFDG